MEQFRKKMLRKEFVFLHILFSEKYKIRDNKFFHKIFKFLVKNTKDCDKKS